ncbi:hypothetical protein DPEC_G00123590 [Dallia pectoralis]|uniref:Uncharacterized protein n=1 Tax=Dallia pectoralis TaxID=75939 RepID=A0ACC2GQU2_DALPE|nr:hypothetical protein DPEC_G00123590 [Dallia pectoralis]
MLQNLLITVFCTEGHRIPGQNIGVAGVARCTIHALTRRQERQVHCPNLSSLGSVTLFSAEAKTDDESDQDHNGSIQHLSSTQGFQKSSEINIYPSATESQMDQSSSRDITPEMKDLQDWYRRLEDLENEVQRVLMENV